MPERSSENPNMWEFPRFDPPTYLHHLKEFLKSPFYLVKEMTEDHLWGGRIAKAAMVAIPTFSGYLAFDAGADALAVATSVAGGYLLTCCMYQYAKFMGGEPAQHSL
jgi:hypothetical protein